MTTHTPPRCISDWVKILDAVVLPASAASLQQALRAFDNSALSMRDIADVIQASPVLALSVIRTANRDPANASRPAESLEVALSRIGLKRAEALIRGMPSVEPSDIPASLRQMILISRHASQQANGLFAARLARLWQEVHWGSLLFLAPVWTLVAARPELLDAWEQRVLVKGELANQVERSLLGVSLLELCAALAEHWRLPAWIGQGYRLLCSNRRMLVKALHIARDNEHPLHQQQMLDADPELRRWLTLPSNTIVLANGIAVSAHHSWNGVHSLRWQRLTGLYLQTPLDELQQLIHQQAAASARALGSTDLWHPAQGLLWPWSSHFQLPRKPGQTERSLPAWRALCRELLAEPSPYRNVLQLTATAKEALASAGMQRALLLVVNTKHNRLVSQQVHGLPIETLKLSLDIGQSQLLRKLLDTPSSIRMTPDNAAQLSTRLPPALQTLFPTEHLLLRSIGIGERVVMLVIADMNDTPFSELDLQAFLKTIQCTERALLTFSKRGR